MANRKGSIRKKNLMLKVAFTPHINTFLNKASIQLQIKDFKVKDIPIPKKPKSSPIKTK